MPDASALPQLRTLGTLRLETLTRERPLLALTYLALHGPSTRRELEDLLWPGAQNPGNSLRVALHHLKRVGPEVVDGAALLSTPIGADVTRLLGGAGEEALTHPPGAFLNTVDLTALSHGLRVWVGSVRARIAQHQRRELLSLAERASVQRAQAYCERAWAVPGHATPEELQRLLHLTDPEGLLHGQVRRALQDQGRLRPTLHHQSALIGRQEVLTVLSYWGLQAGGGVAVISGLGGLGKSSVAREALRALGRLGRSAVQGDAEGVPTAGELLRKLAGLVAPRHPVDRWEALRPHLGLHPVVLLDGVDSLPDLAGFLRTVTQALPDVRWLLTTRFEPDGPVDGPVGGVQIVRLTGLEVPEEHAPLAEVERSPAVQLLLREAALRGLKLRLTGQLAPQLIRLVRAVRGHPLALQQLASALTERDPGELSAELRPWRSVAHVLGQVSRLTWERLPGAAQRQAVRLYPFTDFTVPDAQAFGVTLGDLRALDRHALLDHVAGGSGSPRYRLHPVFLDFLEDQGHPDLGEATGAHARHFLGWAGHQEYPAPALTDQLGNVLRAVEGGLHDAERAPRAIERLAQNHDVRGLHRTGLAWLTELDERATREEAPAAVQAELRAWRAWFQMREGGYAEVLASLRAFLDSPLQALPLARSLMLLAGAVSLSVSGQATPAVNLARQAIAAAHEAGDRISASNASATLLWLLMQGRLFGDARKVLWGLEGQLEALPDTLRVRVQQQVFYARLYLEAGELEAGGRAALREDAHQAAQRAHAHGNHIACASLQITGAMTRWQEEDWPGLADLAGHLIGYSQRHPLVVHEMVGWFLLATARRERGEREGARRAAITGLQLALKHSYVQELLHGLLQGALLDESPAHRALLDRVAADPRITLLARAVARRAGGGDGPEQVFGPVVEAAQGLLRELQGQEQGSPPPTPPRTTPQVT